MRKGDGNTRERERESVPCEEKRLGELRARIGRVRRGCRRFSKRVELERERERLCLVTGRLVTGTSVVTRGGTGLRLRVFFFFSKLRGKE